MDKRFFIVLTIIVLAIVGLFVFTKDKNQSPEGNITSSNHIRDNLTTNIKLLVYGDFECSVCEPFYYVEKQLLEKYPGEITVIFKHFPLDGIHPNARAASRAAEAAGLQNKFFEMHDLLYENQDSWAPSSQPLQFFEGLAEQLGLDVEKFRSDFASELVNNTINADIKEGKERGVEGTPTYYLNDEKLNNNDISTVESFSLKIEALKNAN